MGLFKNADDRFIDRMEKEEKKMLLNLYDLKKSDVNCPNKAYLLQPERLHLTSYEELPNNTIKLNIGYKTRWSGYVSETMRMNYNQIVIGTLFCEEVESNFETIYNRIGSIKIPFLSKVKIISLPIQNSHNIEIKCKKIRVESIDVFVEVDGQLITDDVYRERF